MGFYTFHCDKCGREFETRCTLADRETGRVVCPDCGGNELSRVFGNISVSVKGEQGCPGAAGGICPHSGGKCPHAG